MSTSIIYINTPFSRDEHDAIKALAEAQGRSKGQQLRVLALSAMTKAAKKKGGKAR